jgi:hypothetical protein
VRRARAMPNASAGVTTAPRERLGGEALAATAGAAAATGKPRLRVEVEARGPRGRRPPARLLAPGLQDRSAVPSRIQWDATAAVSGATAESSRRLAAGAASAAGRDVRDAQAGRGVSGAGEVVGSSGASVVSGAGRSVARRPCTSSSMIRRPWARATSATPPRFRHHCGRRVVERRNQVDGLCRAAPGEPRGASGRGRVRRSPDRAAQPQQAGHRLESRV